MKVLRTFALCGLLFSAWGTASAQTGYGVVAGVVRDPAGIRQMGASVVLTTERFGERASTQVLTDQNGVFSLGPMRPGLYSVKASLAGFMPTLQEHIRVSPSLTTIVHIELGSVFASLDALRQTTARPSEDDDWQWVLRTSAATRPVLHVFEPTVATVTLASDDDSAEQKPAPRPRARIEMASGSLHPGSSSGLAGPPATAASYEQSLGSAGRMMVAGRMSYAPELGAGATFAGVWLPAGEFGRGPETVVVLRQARFDSASGRSFRNLRAAHSEKMALADTEVDYGIAYLMAGDESMRMSFRPRLRVSKNLSSQWAISGAVETEPDSHGLRSRGALESALEALDTLPVIIWRDGQGTIAGAWHYELGLKRTLGTQRSIEAAAFRDSSGHVAVFGFDLDDPRGPVEPPIAAYAHDGGASRSWGSRVVYREKLSDDWEVVAIYAAAGALAPREVAEPTMLSDGLETVMRHSLAARLSGRVPGSHTRFSASYKWINGPVASRQDVFGEAALGVDPHLSLSLKQPLPSFGTCGRWEALADFRNLLSQGYHTLDQGDGRMLVTPVVRSFRGGVSFQF